MGTATGAASRSVGQVRAGKVVATMTDQASGFVGRRLARGVGSLAAAAVVLVVLAGMAVVMISSAPLWRWAQGTPVEESVLRDTEAGEPRPVKRSPALPSG